MGKKGKYMDLLSAIYRVKSLNWPVSFARTTAEYLKLMNIFRIHRKETTTKDEFLKMAT